MRKLALALILILAACSRYSADQSTILETSDCNFPCWNNIVAGQTSEQAAIQLLSALAFIEKDSILVTNKPWNIFDNQIFFSFTTESGFSDNSLKLSEIDISNDLVSVVTLCGNLHITIGEIAQEIGEPENLISGGSIAGGRDVILVNPQAGVFYWYNTREIPKDLELEINPEIEIQCVSMFDAGNYARLLDAGMFSMGHYNAEETLKVMYPWNGYGNLDEKYPPRRP